MDEESVRSPDLFNSAKRKDLFLELAARSEGVTAADVYRRAVELGDTVTEEAYYNIARRLVHRGLLVRSDSEGESRYTIGAPTEKRWLEEDELANLVDPDYPLLALAIWKEAGRQINDIPDEVWIELRERLRGRNARKLFLDAILSYCDDFHAQIATLAELERNPTPELPQRHQEAENSRRLLAQLTKHGLGLSKEAVDVPIDVNSAVREFDPGLPYANQELLEAELERRIAPGPVIVDGTVSSSERKVLIGAIDGSTRGGLLSFLGEEGDLPLGYAPMVSINTSIGLVDRLLRQGSRTLPLFIRLPEKPEDMQRRENRYTVMAKLLHPDMSDAQYMHSVWNAMDVIETRAVLRLMKRWPATPDVEVPAADIVLRDGTVSPQDRDFNHYSELSSYGQIVREMIELNWEIAKQCREDGHTVAGVIKHAQLSVFALVLNWFACQVAREGGTQIAAWPLQSMNLVPDQTLLTRILTSGRRKGDLPMRTCLVMRPFHALTNYARTYSNISSPAAPIMEAYRRSIRSGAIIDQEKRVFWESLFREENDPYVKMIENVFYANFFLATVPRLDIEKNLRRVEFIVPAPTGLRDREPWDIANGHLDRLCAALYQNGFDVSAEHTMFRSAAAIDILPRLLIRAHDTVKYWAAELLSRVQEYVGYYLSRYVSTKTFRGIKVRPFTRGELMLLYEQLKRERELQAGAAKTPPILIE